MTERLAYLDPAGGLSGDIFIAAMIAAGVDPRELEAVLKKLDLGPWKLEQEEVRVFGLNALRINFRTDPSPRPTGPTPISGTKSSARPICRTGSRSSALAAFEALARAEAQAHGVEVEKVHFHEVGADDSILDLVGAAACLHLAGISRLESAPVPLSRGVGRAGHGLLPLPAPATLALLKGKPVRGTGSPTELVTPTGAAILSWADSFGEMPGLVLEAVGTGVGQRTPELGLTRICLGRALEESSPDLGRSEKTVVLTTSIDDMNPEFYGPLVKKLLDEGALDATLESVQMKKNRPGTRLEVLAPPELADALAAIILEESTTLGIRWRVENRYCLDRTPGAVEVEGLEVGGKWITRPSGRKEFRPEFEDCLGVSISLDKPINMVYNQALSDAKEE